MRILRGHEGPVRCLAYRPDGQLLASGGDDGTVRLWSPEAGEQRKALAGHTDWVRAVAFSADGQRLASGGWDGRVCLWSTQRSNPLAVHAGYGIVWSLAFAPDAL